MKGKNICHGFFMSEMNSRFMIFLHSGLIVKMKIYLLNHDSGVVNLNLVVYK